MGGGGGGGGGVSGIPMSLISIFESYNFLFHSFLRLLRTYMPMTAKREVHRLSEYLIEGAVWGAPLPPPPHTHTNRFLFILPIACLNFEQTTAGKPISIHFLTVVANFNNLETHPVCNLFSTNEINPSENIFNNNVMHNGISKIVKSWRFNQFLLKSRRLQPPNFPGGEAYIL